MSDDTAPSQENPVEEPAHCTYEDFQKIELRVAEVVAAEEHPNADKLLKLRIRVGDAEKQICAGIKAFYDPVHLVGKRIVVVNNLEPRKLLGEVSEGMLLAAQDADGALALLTTDRPDFPHGASIR